MTIEGVTRELLVRYLDAWTPTALHAGKRATFALGSPDPEAADASLRVFAEFGDRLRARRLTFVAISDDPGTPARLAALQTELGTPANLAVHALTGAPGALLDAALVAAGAAGAPLLVHTHAETPPVRVGSAGRPVELLVVLPPGGWPDQRAALIDAGFPLCTGVELVDGSASRLIAFATGRATGLDAFKNALWSVDEYAGVRFRDPADPAGHLLDVSLDPHPGPLRRELLAHLAAAGPRTVTELRHFTMTDTVYRAADATRVLTALLHAGTITGDAPHGRLGGDVTIRLG